MLIHLTPRLYILTKYHNSNQFLLRGLCSFISWDSSWNQSPKWLDFCIVHQWNTWRLSCCVQFNHRWTYKCVFRRCYLKNITSTWISIKLPVQPGVHPNQVHSNWATQLCNRSAATQQAIESSNIEATYITWPVWPATNTIERGMKFLAKRHQSWVTQLGQSPVWLETGLAPSRSKLIRLVLTFNVTCWSCAQPSGHMIYPPYYSSTSERSQARWMNCKPYTAIQQRGRCCNHWDMVAPRGGPGLGWHRRLHCHSIDLDLRSTVKEEASFSTSNPPSLCNPWTSRSRWSEVPLAADESAFPAQGGAFHRRGSCVQPA